MNIKVSVNAVTRIIDPKVPIEQVYKVVQPVASNARINLGAFTAGAGYLQWALDGEGWIRFKDLDDAEKAVVAQEFTERRQQVIDGLKGAQIASDVLTVPSEEFLLVRRNGADNEIALAAWAYRYPERVSGLELNTWRSNARLQEVDISFSWAGKLIPNMPFMLEGFPHFTDLDGTFHVDKPLPVGKQYRLYTSNNPAPGVEDRTFMFTVEQGKADYCFDMTRWFDIETTVTHDGEPVEGAECMIVFGDRQEKLTTDAFGRTTLRLPLAGDIVGHINANQPECTATCRGKELEFTPHRADEYHLFGFEFETEKVSEPESPVVEEEKAAEPEPPEAPQLITIKILDYDGFPVVNMPLKLKTKTKGTFDYVTDEKGMITVPADIL
ncbi:MAG: hypothetical protein K2L41_00985, partial [Muribaculaceae bacterium]|nr:hypothetical protein [Muribaculaceae bacterium]